MINEKTKSDLISATKLIEELQKQRKKSIGVYASVALNCVIEAVKKARKEVTIPETLEDSEWNFFFGSTFITLTKNFGLGSIC